MIKKESYHSLKKWKKPILIEIPLSKTENGDSPASFENFFTNANQTAS